MLSVTTRTGFLQPANRLTSSIAYQTARRRMGASLPCQTNAGILPGVALALPARPIYSVSVRSWRRSTDKLGVRRLESVRLCFGWTGRVACESFDGWVLLADRLNPAGKTRGASHHCFMDIALYQPPPAEWTLPPDEIHIWRLPTLRTPDELAELASYLTDEERRRVDRFHFDVDRQRAIVSRGWLRRLLGTISTSPRSRWSLTLDPRENCRWPSQAMPSYL